MSAIGAFLYVDKGNCFLLAPAQDMEMSFITMQTSSLGNLLVKAFSGLKWNNRKSTAIVARIKSIATAFTIIIAVKMKIKDQVKLINHSGNIIACATKKPSSGTSTDDEREVKVCVVGDDSW